MPLTGHEIRYAHPSSLNFLQRTDYSFGAVRKVALEYWMAQSSRIRGREDTDDVSDSQYCSLQSRVKQLYGPPAHLALFCNLDDWCSHITDILYDPSNDDLNLTSQDHARRLFRYYARLMIILSELIGDVSQVIDACKTDATRHSRKSNVAGDQLCGFVNSFVKHKKNKSHCYDHHLEIVFQDCPNSAARADDVTFGQLHVENGTRFFIPKLRSIVDIALDCETALAKALKSDDNLRVVFEAYKGVK